MTSPASLQAKSTDAIAAPSANGWLSQGSAIALRELRTAVLNRFVPLFSAAALAVGIAPLLGEHPDESAPYFLVQAALYLIPLFALLIGVGSAQGDLEERAFLWTQPVPRLTMVAGKWAALWGLIFLASCLLVVPSALGGSGACAFAPLCSLGFSTVAIGGVFLGLGMAIGFSTNDRVKAHLAVLCLWLALLAGFDLLALAAVQAGFLHHNATLWLLILMGNPLDAFRIGTLFSLNQAPLDLAQIPALGQWWLKHPGAWLAILSTGWTGAALGWCWLRLRRMEP